MCERPRYVADVHWHLASPASPSTARAGRRLSIVDPSDVRAGPPAGAARPALPRPRGTAGIVEGIDALVDRGGAGQQRRDEEVDVVENGVEEGHKREGLLLDHAAVHDMGHGYEAMSGCLGLVALARILTAVFL